MARSLCLPDWPRFDWSDDVGFDWKRANFQKSGDWIAFSANRNNACCISSGGQMVACDPRAKAGPFGSGFNAGCGRANHCGSPLRWESGGGRAGCHRNFDRSSCDDAFMDFLGDSFYFRVR